MTKKISQWKTDDGALTDRGLIALDTLRGKLVAVEKAAAEEAFIGAGEVRALRAIEQVGEGGLRAVREALGITMAGTAQIVNKLKTQKLVVSTEVEGKRFEVPKLTPDGKKRVQKFMRAYAKLLGAMTEPMHEALPAHAVTVYEAIEVAASA